MKVYIKYNEGIEMEIKLKLPKKVLKLFICKYIFLVLYLC